MIHKFNSYDHNFEIDSNDNIVGSFDFAINGLKEETWEVDTFSAIYNFQDKTKKYLDIGAWVGFQSIYAANLFSDVISIEADKVAIDCFEKNTEGLKNITLIKAACVPENKRNNDVYFSTAKDHDAAKFGDSGSQLRNEKLKDDDYIVKKVTIKDIIKKHSNISFIKCDIEGGEEQLIPDLFWACSSIRSNLFLSFHYKWWENKDLLNEYCELFKMSKEFYIYTVSDGWVKFENNVELLKKIILHNPMISVLFQFS
tara:strand:- start:1273 stop:2040 length:768 start_codon:yes stop_codon:yes gene_type:complete